MDDLEFETLLSQARSGDQQATSALLKRFESDVRIMVRTRLPKALRSRFDTMDFVQAVWQSVFAGGGQVATFANSGHFRGYLSGVARNKVFEEYRRRTTRKFDVAREESITVRRGQTESVRDFAGTDPTPSQVMVAEESFDRLLAAPSPRDAEIVRLKSQGMTLEQVAARTGTSARSVSRVLDAARSRLGMD